MREKHGVSDPVIESVLKKREKCLVNKLDRQTLEEYMLSIQNLDVIYRDIKYSLLLDMNMIEMKNPEAIYPDFYIQKKEIMSALAQSFIGVAYKDIFPDNNQNYIAIYTNTWRDERYSIGIVIATLANEFVRQGYEVTIFVENQCKHDEKIQNILSAELLVNAEMYHLDHKKMVLPQVNVSYAKGDTIEAKITCQINNIFEYGPALILDMADENSCCSRILYEKFPVFYFPMRSNHGSSMFFHKYLAADPKRIKQIVRKYHCFDEKLIVPFVGGVTNFPEAKVCYNKETELGRKKSFVLITVGNRLSYDIDNEFVDFAISLLQRNSYFLWVFVGTDLPDYLLQERIRLNLQERIVLRGYEKDLVALYHICDLYVNPRRKGGGLSIAWAMHEGIPIAMLKYLSDGLLWLGEENAVDGGYDELADYIFSLWKDPRLYEAEKRKIQKRINQRTTRKCIEQIVELLYLYMKDREICEKEEL